MLGRGLLANPALAQELNGGLHLTRKTLRDFHDKLYEGYMESHPANVTLIRMRVAMNHLACCFENPKKALKTIRKAQNIQAYLEAIEHLFCEYEMRERPMYKGPEDLNF